MALIKEKILKNGITIEYWAAQPRYSVASQSTEIIMFGFLNEEARDNKAEPLDKVNIGHIDGHKSIEEVYTYMKASRMSELQIDYKLPEEAIQEMLKTYEPSETNWFADAEDLI